MSVTKIKGLIADFIQVFIEQVWLFGIIMLLMTLAGLGVASWKKSDRNHAHSQLQPPHIASEMQEMTSAEMAIIVAKPITALLKMRVYFDDKASKSNQLVAELSEDDIFLNGTSNKVLAHQSRRVNEGMITLKPINKNKKQAMAEQS